MKSPRFTDDAQQSADGPAAIFSKAGGSATGADAYTTPIEGSESTKNPQQVQAEIAILSRQVEMPKANAILPQKNPEKEKNRLEARSRQAAQDISFATHKAESYRQENEILLSQLHLTQERLESLSTEKSLLHSRLKALDTEYETHRARNTEALQDFMGENRRLLHQLHQTQEKLESTFLRLHSTEALLTEHRERLSRMLDRHPTYWDFDDLQVKLVECTDERHILEWNITGAYLGKRLVPHMRFKTCLSHERTGIIIQRTDGIDSSSPLIRWPSVFAQADELPCIPAKGPATSGSNAALSSLGPSDWEMLKCLVRQLLGFIAEPANRWMPDQFDAKALRNGLLAYQKVLANWPLVPRYDTIQLKDMQRSTGYERIAITLGNFSIGHRHWPTVDYHVATADSAADVFGQHPRLEFPTSARGAIQGWFAESDDERGPRLELRFGLPDAMDTNIWGLLTDNDQILVAGLIASLPAQLADLELLVRPNPARAWKDWYRVGISLRNILAHRTRAARQTALA